MRTRKKPLKTHLSKREVEICARVKKAREALGLTQDKCAEIIGITKGRLANYELCRSPLRIDVAIVLCKRLVVSEQWLATGQGQMRQLLFLSSSFRFGKIPPGSLLSVAYDQFLKADAEEYASNLEGDLFRADIAELLRSPDHHFFRNALQCLMDVWLKQVPDEKQTELFMAVVRSGYAFLDGIGKK